MPNTAVVLKTSYLALDFGSGLVDISDWTSKIELNCEVDEKDVTTYGSAGWMEVIGGLAKGELGLKFLNDYLDNQLDELLWSVFGTRVSFETRPTSAAVSANNPKWTGTVLVKEVKPISGSVGDTAEMDVSFPTSGVVTRGTS